MYSLLKNLNKNKMLLIMLFLVNFLVFSYISTNYNSARSPDFIYYTDYISYFFNNLNLTGREQGLIYFFLVSLTIKFFDIDFGAFSYELSISNSIIITNYLLFSIGLIGLFKLLQNRKFSSKNILFSFLVISLFPQSINMILTMKPEIIAFSTLPWSIFLILKYLENSEIKYLYVALFPNLILLTTKATIIGSVGLIYLFILLHNLDKFKNINFYKFLTISLILISLLFYENAIANGKNIREHTNTKPEYQDKARLAFLFHLNLRELITNPFRHNHANSLLGILMLDTFGDYFQNYALHDNSLFAFSRKNIPRIFVISHWTQFLSIILTISYYIATIYYFRKNKTNNIFYVLHFFGIIILILQAFGFPQINFNANMADTFKTHYYSFLLVISFTFLITSLISQFPKIKLGVLFLAIFTFFNLYGLNKIENKNYLQLISLRSNISATCSFNSIFLDDLDSESCNSAVIKICKTTPHITNTNFLIQKELSNLYLNNYYPSQVLYKENTEVVPRTVDECIKYVKKGYGYLTYLQNPIRVPIVNLIFYILSIASLGYAFFIKE